MIEKRVERCTQGRYIWVGRYVGMLASRSISNNSSKVGREGPVKEEKSETDKKN